MKRDTSSSARVTATFGAVFVLLGLVLAFGGLYLAVLGGSWYYLLAGIGVAFTGVLLVKADRRALWLYAFVLAATVIWSVYEVRFDWWQTVPRIALWLALGLYLLLPWLNRKLGGGEATNGNTAVAIAITLALIVPGIGLFTDYDDYAGELPVVRMSASGSHPEPGVAPNDWIAYGRSAYGTRYSPAKQITPEMAGGHGSLGTKMGDSLLAYALPAADVQQGKGR